MFSGGGYARIIELQDGRLMAVCESGGIKIAFSQDKGSTWGSATKIVSNPAGIRECVPDLIQLSDGTIIVAYNPRPTSPYSEERKFGIRCKRSTDGGRTWSDEIFVNVTYRGTGTTLEFTLDDDVRLLADGKEVASGSTIRSDATYTLVRTHPHNTGVVAITRVSFE